MVYTPKVSDQARYWGVLNRYRRITLSRHGKAKTLSDWVLAMVVTIFLEAVALGAVFFGARDVGFVVGVLGTASALGTIGILIHGAWQRRLFAKREVVRKAWQASLGQFVAQRGWQHWGSSMPYRARPLAGGQGVEAEFTTGTIQPVRRFLEGHWWGNCPRLLVECSVERAHQRVSYTTLTGELGEAPFMVHLADGEPRASASLFVLVALPLDLSLATAPPSDTPPGQALAADGFEVHRTSSGIVAWLQLAPDSPHRGQEVQVLQRVARAVFDLAAMGPMGSAVAAPTPPPEPANNLATIEVFLTALRDSDAPTAVARTDLSILQGPLEPSLVAAISVVEAIPRPVSWQLIDLHNQTANAFEQWYQVQFADGSRRPVSVHLYAFKMETSGKYEYLWLVRGFAVFESDFTRKTFEFGERIDLRD